MQSLKQLLQFMFLCFLFITLKGSFLSNLLSTTGKLSRLFSTNHLLPVSLESTQTNQTKKWFWLTSNNIKQVIPRLYQIKYSYFRDKNSNLLNEVNKQNNFTLNSMLHLKYMKSVKQFNKRFHKVIYKSLMSNAPADKVVNGISFVESGILVHMLLTALSIQADPKTNYEIEKCTYFSATVQEKIQVMEKTVSWLPKPDDMLKFQWASRLLVTPQVKINRHLTTLSKKINLKIDSIQNTRRSGNFIDTLNDMIKEDSGGIIHDTFDTTEELSNETGMLISTVYVRPQWRVAPTLLNVTKDFYDGDTTKQTRMIKVIDQVRYAFLEDLDAEIIEIQYATPGLSLVMVVPRSKSLQKLANRVVDDGLTHLLDKMQSKRAAVYIPLYTLRMTLLLPNKLSQMGVNRLISPKTDDHSSDNSRLTISYAIQRIMFWSEAGRHAYKDDGLQWEEQAQLEVFLNRPYLFFLQWKNVIIMNGQFNL